MFQAAFHPQAGRVSPGACPVRYARVACNHALEHFKARLESGEILGETSLRKRWNSVKGELAPWHSDKEDKKKIHSEIAAKNAIKYGLRGGIKARIFSKRFTRAVAVFSLKTEKRYVLPVKFQVDPRVLSSFPPLVFPASDGPALPSVGICSAQRKIMTENVGSRVAGG